MQFGLKEFNPATGKLIYYGEELQRSYFIAILMTIILPGLGHIYLGNLKKGLALFVGCFIPPIVTLITWVYVEYQPAIPFLILAIFLVVFYLWILLDVILTLSYINRKIIVKGYNHWTVYLFILILAISTLYIFYKSVQDLVLTTYLNQSVSMSPLISKGERILVDRVFFRSFQKKGLNLGDIVVFKNPKTQKPALQRVIGLPGDVISIYQDKILRNGTVIKTRLLSSTETETYALEKNEKVYQIKWDKQLKFKAPRENIILKDNDICLLGDNRDQAEGTYCYTYGKLPVTYLIGRVVAKIYSNQPKQSFWKRFFIKL